MGIEFGGTRIEDPMPEAQFVGDRAKGIARVASAHRKC
jgi:hypothetical protein